MAHFDNKFVLDCLIRHKQTISIDAGLGLLRWKDAKIIFCDSHQLLRTSLERACETFNVDRKLKWDHKTTKPIREMSANERGIFRAYLERDCRSLSEAYGSFVWEIISTFDIPEPSQTLAQTALKIFNTKYHKLEDIESNREYLWAIKESLYGARNEVYNKYGEDLNLFDIRSMYVSCYDIAVPVGPMRFVRPKMNRGVIAEADVEVPEDFFIGPLPYHTATRLIFPVGKFTSWWDMVELRYAEELGCKVTLKRQLECTTEPILKEFGEEICRLRYSANPNLARLWKNLGLLLIGKLAQSRPRTTVKHISELTSLEGWTPLEGNEEYLEGNREISKGLEKYLDKMSKPAITARIRAEARVRHHKVLMEARETGEIYYCDTDSIYSTADLELGPDAGNLQLLDKAVRAYFIMSKFYGYVTEEGILRQRSSGVSSLRLDEQAFKDLLRGREIQIQDPSPSFPSVNSIVGGNGVQAAVRRRTIRTPFNQQNRIFEGGTTRPLVVGKDI